MANVSLTTIVIVTDGSGDFTVDTTKLQGRFLQYRYVPDPSTPLSNMTDITVVGKKTGFTMLALVNIGTNAFQDAPRQDVSDDAGDLYLFATSKEVPDHIYLDEQLTVTIAEGGDTLSGTFYMWTGQ